MKKYFYLLLVLLAIAAVASAGEKKDELRYEVNVTLRFNSLSVSEFAEVQKALDGLAAKSCKTEINLEKLPKDEGFTTLSIGGGTWVTPTSDIGLIETKEDNE
ncbi:MAG: hypothetical protein M0Z43_02315 [Acidithiobacillus sp.]|nr:hypothetical protein [Acidithiobacillus sp.]